jgi:hypothetical protein
LTDDNSDFSSQVVQRCDCIIAYLARSLLHPSIIIHVLVNKTHDNNDGWCWKIYQRVDTFSTAFRLLKRLQILYEYSKLASLLRSDLPREKGEHKSLRCWHDLLLKQCKDQPTFAFVSTKRMNSNCKSTDNHQFFHISSSYNKAYLGNLPGTKVPMCTCKIFHFFSYTWKFLHVCLSRLSATRASPTWKRHTIS